MNLFDELQSDVPASDPQPDASAPSRESSSLQPKAGAKPRKRADAASMAKAQKEIDALWDNGSINEETINQWGAEHMRTPYRYASNRT